MAIADLIDTKGAKVGEIEVKDEIFNVEVKPYLIHDVVKMQLASRRSGTASTKTRRDVSGGGKKPFRQKGTGRARQGTSRSPLQRGGGTVFGPSSTQLQLSASQESAEKRSQVCPHREVHRV